MTDKREELIELRRQIQKVLEEGRAFPADVLSAQIVLAFEKAQNARDLPKSDIAGGGISLSEHTPTDDERASIIAELRWLAEARKKYETDTFPSIAREVQTTLHLADILERRTPVAEGGQGFGWIPSWLWEEWDQMAARRTVQDEPTDAVLDAALDAWFRAVDEGEYSRDAMHAALRAAAATQTGENR